MFWTGAQNVPPGGFRIGLQRVDPSIDFFTPRPGITALPTSSTCGLVLHLPRGMEDPELFDSNVVRAIKESGGFGKV